MSAYVQQLQQHADRDHAAQAAAAEASREIAARTARERLTPLEDRLAKLLATIPAEVQREGLSLPALIPALRGRWRAHADAGQLGTALRKLGWRRERKWRGQNLGFSALWRPPGT